MRAWESAGSGTPANYGCINDCSAAAQSLSDDAAGKLLGNGPLQRYNVQIGTQQEAKLMHPHFYYSSQSFFFHVAIATYVLFKEADFVFKCKAAVLYMYNPALCLFGGHIGQMCHKYDCSGDTGRYSWHCNLSSTKSYHYRQVCVIL